MVIPVDVPCRVRGHGAVERRVCVRLGLQERPLLRLVVEQPQDGRRYNLESCRIASTVDIG